MIYIYIYHYIVLTFFLNYFININYVCVRAVCGTRINRVKMYLIYYLSNFIYLLFS